MDILLIISDVSMRGILTATRMKQLIGELRTHVGRTALVVNRIEKLIATPRAHILQVGDIQMNCRTRLVRRGDAPYQKLTPKQAKLLETLMRHAGQVLTRRYLMKQVWQTDYMGDTRTLDVHIRWVREKIELNPSKPIYITTKRREGYRFAAPKGEAPDNNAKQD